MNEIAAALRQFADRLERGELGVEAASAAIVVSSADGVIKANYIGREAPAAEALIFLMARGIQQTVSSKLQGTMTQAAA